MPDILLKNITKRFGKGVAVDNLNLKINDGDFITLLGPSGCGKTTILRMIAGLETPSEGEISIDGKIVFSSESGINIPPNKRNVGFLFQNYALWPHMTVYQNITFGLENLKWDKSRIEKKLKELLKMLKIENYENRYPNELSGGQQQRVAIARTLATEPNVLFMDEPLSNLDAKLRMDMRTELKRLHLETKSTFVYVTHDQLEAMTLSTKICLLKNGKLQQYDAPLIVYDSPANTFAADFVGNPAINLLKGKIISANDDKIEIEVQHIRLSFIPQKKVEGSLVGKDVIIGVRPEYIKITQNIDAKSFIYSTLPSGMETIVKVKCGELMLTSVLFGSMDFKVNEKVGIDFVGDKCILFDDSTQGIITLGKVKILN